MKFQKVIIILSTASAGAFGMMTAIDYFAEQGRALDLIKSAFSSSVEPPGTCGDLLAPDTAAHCWFTDLTVAIWPVFSLIGIFVQFRYTGRRWDHRRGCTISPLSLP